jgi:acyl-CoA synthetase (AMP-forming)/AMP-acid ligase II
MAATTLANLLADPTSAQPAIIIEPGGVAISYRALAEQVERLAEEFRGARLRAGDAVALVLPNGPELLVLILALARAGLIAVPLNPAFKADELRVLFAGVDPCAIFTAPGNGAVADAAAGLAAPIWAASVEPSRAVHLAGIPPGQRGAPEAPNAEDVALFLHTSGTEGRPKVVPLTHANVVCAALHVASHYALTPADRTLVVMPLFHGHGLIGAALATLVSGGAVIVPPRFSASRFWGSFQRHRASWYTAVPTIHEILLQRADADGAPHAGPRFIRSCSAALAPAVLAALEHRFGAPVVQAYGLTEASHQVASNPLPPSPRRSGTVGFGTGTEIAIIDTHGRHLPAHRAGEVVVRVPSVMHGYRNNPAANAAAFADGWLRTGDAGALDDDGYLTFTGRIKEMINRGGEKISPTEIDAVLLAHPAVAEAAAFGVPDPKYGEEVQAAVVLKGGADAEGLRAFCRERLADFKVPKVIRIVSRLPKNALGKVERRALTALYAPAVDRDARDKADATLTSTGPAAGRMTDTLARQL